MTRIAKTSLPSGHAPAEFRRYFTELREEYDLRAHRIATRIMTGATMKECIRDFTVDKPSWECEDVACLRGFPVAELKALLPPLFDSFRNLTRAQKAVGYLRHHQRAKRRVLMDELMADVHDVDPHTRSHVVIDRILQADPERAASAAYKSEMSIEEWIAPMFEPCAFDKSHHFAGPCRKPLTGCTKADLRGTPLIDPTTNDSEEEAS